MTDCPHVEEVAVLVRFDDKLMCRDCAADEWIRLDDEWRDAQRDADRRRDRRDTLAALGGYDAYSHELMEGFVSRARVRQKGGRR
jgi:hypothetical protein